MLLYKWSQSVSPRFGEKNLCMKDPAARPAIKFTALTVQITGKSESIDSSRVYAVCALRFIYLTSFHSFTSQLSEGN